mmetsp:Transcript_10446/g.24880  ORF Transcript_10446/g.24880 Transcript_10446/m.24880 type:complete len:318 (-) Transcript_10446:674-1627(-)
MDEVSHRERLSVSPRAGNLELHQLVEVIEDRLAPPTLQNVFEDGIVAFALSYLAPRNSKDSIPPVGTALSQPYHRSGMAAAERKHQVPVLGAQGQVPQEEARIYSIKLGLGEHLHQEVLADAVGAGRVDLLRRHGRLHDNQPRVRVHEAVKGPREVGDAPSLAKVRGCLTRCLDELIDDEDLGRPLAKPDGENLHRPLRVLDVRPKIGVHAHRGQVTEHSTPVAHARASHGLERAEEHAKRGCLPLRGVWPSSLRDRFAHLRVVRQRNHERPLARLIEGKLIQSLRGADHERGLAGARAEAHKDHLVTRPVARRRVC